MLSTGIDRGIPRPQPFPNTVYITSHLPTDIPTPSHHQFNLLLDLSWMVFVTFYQTRNITENCEVYSEFPINRNTVGLFFIILSQSRWSIFCLLLTKKYLKTSLFINVLIKKLDSSKCINTTCLFDLP